MIKLTKFLLTDHSGTGHKMAHNITTIANIPLVAWLIYAFLSLRGASYDEFISWITSPVNMVIAIFFILTTLIHFTLELEVVIEDYVSGIKCRNRAIKLLKTVLTLIGAAAIISLLKVGL